jgi:DNA-binding response OmpR family regulator
MAQASPLRVLVLEDEWLIAEQIEAALNDAGFDIVGPVGRIEEAMALLSGDGIDAAVLDINVHGQRTFRVAERLAARSTPFVFLSGYSEVELPSSFSERPLMQKPIDPVALGHCVISLLRAKT